MRPQSLSPARGERKSSPAQGPFIVACGQKGGRKTKNFNVGDKKGGGGGGTPQIIFENFRSEKREKKGEKKRRGKNIADAVHLPRGRGGKEARCFHFVSPQFRGEEQREEEKRGEGR